MQRWEPDRDEERERQTKGEKWEHEIEIENGPIYVFDISIFICE